MSHITLLLAAGRRQSFAEIVERLSELDPVRFFDDLHWIEGDDLHWIEGVLFLSTEPPGLALLPELRTELMNLDAIRAVSGSL
jgi:hypothetical protein